MDEDNMQYKKLKLSKQEKKATDKIKRLMKRNRQKKRINRYQNKDNDLIKSLVKKWKSHKTNKII